MLATTKIWVVNRNSLKNSRALYSKDKRNVQRLMVFTAIFALLTKKAPLWTRHNNNL